MRSILFVSAISLGSGCAAHMAPAPTTPPAQVASDTTPSEEHETERVRELRAELALANARSAEQEIQGVRDRMTLGADSPAESENGFFSEDGDGDWDQPAEELPPTEAARETREDRNRPMLRLYGVPQAPPISAAAQGLPALPYASVPYRPVTTTAPAPPTSVVPSNDHLPWETAPARAASTPQRTVASPQPLELGLESYRTALGMLRSRRFAESLVAFERFERAHPNHPQVANARYWRAELYYIQRQYGQARTAFQSYVGRYPRGRRVADALLKLSLCSRRLGNEREATAHMDRLRRDFPSSEAARMASREVNR